MTFCFTLIEASPKAKVVLATSTSNRRSSGRNQGVHELSACEQLTVELVRHEDSWPFMKLVSKTQVTHTQMNRIYCKMYNNVSPWKFRPGSTRKHQNQRLP